jgi:putative ABC transport system ATP-binding protein
MSIVRLRDVVKVYPLGKTEVHALNGVSLDVARGDFVSISGPSGSGKSTVLNLIGCIDTATRGEVSIGGVETSSLNDRELTRLRHEVLGFIFQSFNLIPVLNVFENVEFPLLIDGASMPRRERTEWVDYLVEDVGLGPWRDHRPAELSGGQRQRVAIARALATRPQIVLADEPTANLDSESSAKILELMRKMNREFGTTFVFSTHDSDVVDLADHVIRLRDGRVVEDTLVRAPAHAERADLVANGAVAT